MAPNLTFPSSHFPNSNPRSRKQLVLTVFQRLDVEDAGVLKVENIMQNIDFKTFAGAINGGPNAVANEMLDSFEQGSVEWLLEGVVESGGVSF